MTFQYTNKTLKRKFVDIESYNNLLGQMVPDHKLSYIEYGSDNKEIVFCVHGLTRNASDFHFLANKLSQKFRVISLDVAGGGMSDKFENYELYNYVTYCTDVIKFLEALNISEVNYIGTSMGGIIGMVLTSRFNSLFKTFIINDVGPEIPKEAVERIIKYVGTDIVCNNYDFAKNLLKKVTKPFGIKDEKYWDFMTENSFLVNENFEYKLSYDKNIKHNFMKDSASDEVQKTDLWEVWKSIKCPIMIIHGLESDILTKDILDRMLEIQTEASLVQFDCGHAPSLFYEEQITPIFEWLNKR